MTDFKLLIFANPVPGREDEFDDWYDTHVQEIVQTEHVVGAQRFRVVDRADPGLGSTYRNLVIADWRADDLEASWTNHYRAVQEATAKGAMTPLTPAFDTSSALHWFFTPVSPRLEG